MRLAVAFVFALSATPAGFLAVAQAQPPKSGATPEKRGQDDKDKDGAPQAKEKAEKAEGTRLDGRVQSVDGEKLVLRTKDGRVVTVNIKDISAETRQRIQPNEPIIIVGHREGDRIKAQSVAVAGTMAGAQVLAGQPPSGVVGGARSDVRGSTEQKAEQQGAASPATEGVPRSIDECKDDGWQKFTKPKFKDQADCVRWLNRPPREDRKK